jgi:hypothetical protein
MRWQLLVVIAVGAGCGYQRPVQPAALAVLHGAAGADQVVLDGVGALRARVDANSRIRFRDASGAWTVWLDADTLFVDDRGVYLDDGPPAWTRRGWRWSEITAAEVAGTLGPDVDGAAAWAPSPADRVALAAPALFDDGAQRRSWVRVLASGDELASSGLMIGGVGVGVRLRDLVELGGGAHHVSIRDEASGAWTTGTALSLFARGNVFLDAGRRWALPVGIDAGTALGDDEATFVRLRAGLRVRLSDKLFAGAYPFNPVRIDGAWSTPSGLELGLAF